MLTILWSWLSIIIATLLQTPIWNKNGLGNGTPSQNWENARSSDTAYFFTKNFLHQNPRSSSVIPAKAGIHTTTWIPGQARNDADKSLQTGFLLFIKLTFHSLFHFLICFSLSMATFTSLTSS